MSGRQRGRSSGRCGWCVCRGGVCAKPRAAPHHRSHPLHHQVLRVSVWLLGLRHIPTQLLEEAELRAPGGPVPKSSLSSPGQRL
ncbi:hypothetical protein Hamer_G029597 [Homarus americanus]|uniref:Uncharacterized protein n=1 Tax=Homarus americanus TaxID=6706 RepID=A0A8J5TC25_HOMAM|nr:hypothetical protein Hamer_G029597 [Homarus americanus]